MACQQQPPEMTEEWQDQQRYLEASTLPTTQALQRCQEIQEEEYSKKLLEQEGVAVLSDIHFGVKVPNSGEHIRFSYAASIAEIEKGLNKLDNFIKTNQKNNF